MLIALCLGVLFGIQNFFNIDPILSIAVFLVRFYFLLLAITIVPIFVFSLISSASILIKAGRVLQTAIRLFVVFLSTLLACSVVVTVLFITVDAFFAVNSTEDVRKITELNTTVEHEIAIGEDEKRQEYNSVRRFFLSIVPGNIYQSLINEYLPPIVFFALMLGIVLGIIQYRRVKVFIHLVHSLYFAFQKIFRWLMYFLPLFLFILIVDYIRTYNFTFLRPAFIFAIIFLIMTVVSIGLVIPIFMMRRKQSFISACRMLFRVTFLGIAANNHITALPEVLRIFGKDENDLHPSAGAVIPFLFSMGNIGYFLFLNLFALFAMSISSVSVTLLGWLIIFAASLLFSLTSNTYGIPVHEKNEYLFFVSNTGVVPYFTMGFWTFLAPLIRPLQIFYSLIMNIFMTSMILPTVAKEQEETVLLKISQELQETVFDVQLDDDESEEEAAVAQVADDQDDFDEDSVLEIQKQKPKRKSRFGFVAIPFRLSVVILTTVLILTFGFLSTLLSYSGSRVSLYNLASTFMDEITQNTTDHISEHLHLSERVLNNMNVFFQNREIFDNDEEFISFFNGLIENNPEFVAMYYGSKDGSFRMVKRMLDKSFSVRQVQRQGDRIVSTWEHENTEYVRTFPNISFESLEEGYDPRQRPWYKTAAIQEKLSWSDVYVFASDKQLGLTTALPIYDNAGELQGVFGIDIGLQELSAFLSDIDLGENGHAFIVEKESKSLVAVSVPAVLAAENLYYSVQDGDQSIVERMTLDTTPLPYPFLAYDAYVQEHTIANTGDPLLKFFLYLLGSLHEDKELFESYTFEYDNGEYLSTIGSISPSSDIHWQLGLVLYVGDFMAAVNQNNVVIIVFSIFLIIVVASIGSVIAARISIPIAGLAREMDVVKIMQTNTVRERAQSRIREIREMNTSFDSMLNGLISFKKYVPADLVTRLIQMQGSAKIGGDRQEITLLFSDIRNFTTLSEQMEPEELLEKLELYFDMFNTILLRSHATIDKYIGDAVMAFWGAPVPIENHAHFACHAAIEFMRELRQSELADIFYTRIGIHTGSAIVGNVGSSKRLNYTAIGDSVNIASRLENLNKYYDTGIIVSESILDHVGDDFSHRFLDNVVVKGKQQGMKIFELVGEKNEVELLRRSGESSEEIHNFLKLYQAGTRYYQQRDWGKAVHYFARAYDMRRHDLAAKLMYLRCYKFYQSPPPSDWDGVVVFQDK